MTSPTLLDRSLNTPVAEGFGTITIRVVVLDKKMAARPALAESEDAPADAAPDEDLPDSDKQPTTTFLEQSKRGRQVCVFLINGQRQHAWDNHFIVRDLAFKYLRHRMIVVVDCDGLRPEAIAELMQGSRHTFFEGEVYAALGARVIATLKGDPDLRRLEEQAEDDIASLQAGDEVVKNALDQLIESHHESAEHVSHGTAQGGESTRNHAYGTLIQTKDVVMEGELGPKASDPVLQLRPDIATIRLKPNDPRRLLLHSRPEASWKVLESMGITFDPPVKELQVTRSAQLGSEEVTLKFDEPDDFDDDEYPIETTLRATATFTGQPETRLLERRVVVTPPSDRVLPKPPKPLLDDPTYLKVTSRQPIKIVIGGADVHVKMRWDGKDELLTGTAPEWTIRVTCDSPSVEPLTFPTRPIDGRFEVLIQASPGLHAGEQLKFDLEAIGPGKTLSTAFLADVVEAPSARRSSAKIGGGAQRRPPYELKYLKRTDWNNGDLNCFGQPWTGAEPGSFEEPNPKSPLTIFINQDTDLLTTYRDSLLAKKLAESTIAQRINKYTAHVAFHLYLMYLQHKTSEEERAGQTDSSFDDMMREEVQRVAQTLIKLMEVTQ